jgi:hypothetical protein
VIGLRKGYDLSVRYLGKVKKGLSPGHVIYKKFKAEFNVDNKNINLPAFQNAPIQSYFKKAVIINKKFPNLYFFLHNFLGTFFY